MELHQAPYKWVQRRDNNIAYAEYEIFTIPAANTNDKAAEKKVSKASKASKTGEKKSAEPIKPTGAKKNVRKKA